MARLLAVETHDCWVASSMHAINIHWSGAIFWGWGTEALCRGRWSEAWKHFLHQSECCFGLGQRQSGAYRVVHHILVRFYKGFVCLSVPGHLACGFIPSFGVVEVGSPILKQHDLVLKCWIKSTSELDDNSLVIIIFHQVSELLEVVNIVINWILSLVPAVPSNLVRAMSCSFFGQNCQGMTCFPL